MPEPVVNRLWVAGLVLGMGLGGFVDGIGLHELLNWHHMLSSWYPLTSRHNERINMIGDGLFHAVCWLIVVGGIVLLVRATRDPAPHVGRVLIGGVISGWGAFNLVEGVIDHLVLGVHHVWTGPHRLAYDLGFLIFGAALFLAGWATAQRTGAGTAPPPRRATR
jgi:uncharacterized membrane protein